MTTLTTTLELRCVEIPRTYLVVLLELELGRPPMHEYRHFLAGEPAFCGMALEYLEDGSWIRGRYQWTCYRQDLPTLHIGERVIELAPDDLLRWPECGLGVRHAA
jgi:hypothetical protein